MAAIGPRHLYNGGMESVFARLGVTREQVAELCRRSGIRRLTVFGSALRQDFGADSDVDLVVEFEPGLRVGLRFFDVKREFESLLGRPVDLLSREHIREAYRHEILSSAEDVYVAA